MNNFIVTLKLLYFDPNYWRYLAWCSFSSWRLQDKLCAVIDEYVHREGGGMTLELSYKKGIYCIFGSTDVSWFLAFNEMFSSYWEWNNYTSKWWIHERSLGPKMRMDTFEMLSSTKTISLFTIVYIHLHVQVPIKIKLLSTAVQDTHDFSSLCRVSKNLSSNARF